jgi:hypothetical protein
VYAWYSLIGTGGAALGILSCGWLITTMEIRNHVPPIEAYRTVFFVYAAIGVIKLILALLLSTACEMASKPVTTDAPETAPLLNNEATTPTIKKKGMSLPHISRESRVVLLQLAVLFAFDSFASGLVPL